MMTDTLDPQATTPDRLTPDELARLTMARCLVARWEAELRAARAVAELCLRDIREAHALGPGDVLNPTTGEIRRAGETPA